MRNRVATHVRTLGILWLVRAGLRLVTGLFLSSFFSSNWWYLNGGMGMPHFVPGLLRGVGFILLAGAIAGALAGWGLLERRPWARTLAMVIGVLALFDFPIGTALGIYTLWVLAPATSEMEYRAMAGPA